MVTELRAAVRADGRSLNELEKLSDLNAGQLSRFVAGKRDLTFESATRLLKTLGIGFTMPDRPAAEEPKREPAPKPAKRRAK
jgi:hypothetical protein